MSTLMTTLDATAVESSLSSAGGPLTVSNVARRGSVKAVALRGYVDLAHRGRFGVQPSGAVAIQPVGA